MSSGWANTDGMVLILGATGSGKSAFINTLKPGSANVGHGLESSENQQANPIQGFMFANTLSVQLARAHRPCRYI